MPLTVDHTAPYLAFENAIAALKADPKYPDGNLFCQRTDRAIQAARTASHKAMAYVWGWQDRENEADSDVSQAFAFTYGLHVLRYEIGESFFQQCIQKAWTSWCETGEIR